MAVLSTRGPMAVLSKQKQPDGRTSRFQRKFFFFFVLSRTISLSAAGPSYCQQKQAQWPFYQRETQWPFYQSRSTRMARLIDFSNNWPYQRPGQAILSKSRPNGRFIKAEAPSPRKQFISIRAKPPKASPIAVLSRPGPMAV